jgi:hypothetical protein
MDALPPPTHAEIAADVRDYYEAERTIALTFLGLGAGSAGVGVVLVRRQGDWSHGIGWAMIGLGSLEAIGATFYAYQVGKEIDHYSASLASDPRGFKEEEAAHIHGTTSRFVLYRSFEAGLTLAGLGVATYGFAAKDDLWKGVGIGVAAEAFTFLALDTIGSARAHDYEDRVKRFDPKVGFTVGDRAFGLSSAFAW